MLQLDDIRILTGPYATFGPLTLALKPGRWMGVIGPHGSCKSLLLQALAGLVKPDGGRRVIQLKPEQRAHWLAGHGVRYLPGGEPFDLHMRVGTVLSTRAALRGYRGRKRREVLTDLREIWNLEPIWPRRLGELSRGVRRRVAVADAFLGSPRVVLLDDPFWGCDDLQIRNIRDGLNAAKRTDVSVVVATRSRQELTALVADVMELSEGGHVKFSGEWKEWLNQRADAGVYRLVARGPGGKIAGILKRVKGVYDVLWHEGGPWNTYELRAETEPRVREMIFRVLAVKNYPIIELAVETNPHSMAEAEAARDQADVKAALKPVKPGTRAAVGARRDPTALEPATTPEDEAMVAAATVAVPPVPPPPGDVAAPPVPPPPVAESAPGSEEEVAPPVDLAAVETAGSEPPADAGPPTPTPESDLVPATVATDEVADVAPAAGEPVADAGDSGTVTAPAEPTTPEPEPEPATEQRPAEPETEAALAAPPAGPEPASVDAASQAGSASDDTESELEPATTAGAVPPASDEPSPGPEAAAPPVAEPVPEPVAEPVAEPEPVTSPVLADTAADFTPAATADDDGWGPAEVDDGWGPGSEPGTLPPPPPPLPEPEPDFTPQITLPEGVRVVPQPQPAAVEPPPLPGEEPADGDGVEAVPMAPDALDSDFDWTEGADLPPAPDWAASLPDGADSAAVESPVYQRNNITATVNYLTGDDDAAELSGLPDLRGTGDRSKTAAFATDAAPGDPADTVPADGAASEAGDDDVEVEEFDDVDFRAAAINMSGGTADDLDLLKSLMAEEDSAPEGENNRPDDNSDQPDAG